MPLRTGHEVGFEGEEDVEEVEVDQTPKRKVHGRQATAFAPKKTADAQFLDFNYFNFPCAWVRNGAKMEGAAHVLVSRSTLMTMQRSWTSRRTSKCRHGSQLPIVPSDSPSAFDQFDLLRVSHRIVRRIVHAATFGETASAEAVG